MRRCRSKFVFPAASLSSASVTISRPCHVSSPSNGACEFPALRSPARINGYEIQPYHVLREGSSGVSGRGIGSVSAASKSGRETWTRPPTLGSAMTGSRRSRCWTGAATRGHQPLGRGWASSREGGGSFQPRRWSKTDSARGLAVSAGRRARAPRPMGRTMLGRMRSREAQDAR